MTAIDRRIAIRRHTVRETGARQRLRQVLAALAFLTTVGLIALLLQSPVMAVREINVQGADRADVKSVLDRYDVVTGVPTISVRPGEIAAIIEEDPWVARAQASIQWPGTVTVVVLEHEPVAWVSIGDEWYRASGDGAILQTSKPTKRGPRVKLTGPSGEPGMQLRGRRVLAALELLALLPQELRMNAAVTGGGGGGTLLARIAGHAVDLGSPVDMAEKAATLSAIIANGVPEGASISVVSPSRPAIRNPK